MRNLRFGILIAAVATLVFAGCDQPPEQHVHSFTAAKKTGTTDEWNLKCSCGEVKEGSSFHAAYLETLGTYTDLGSGKYTFGVYPQTIKAASVTVDKGVKNPEITGAAYYLGSDGAWYAECIENGFVTGSSSNNSQYQYSDGSYVSEKNAGTPKTLYFKVEPIEWTKLSTTGCLVADKILTANVPYYESKSNHRNEKHSNNYEHSQIRAYLNGISYNAANSKEEGKWKGKGFL